VPSRYASTAVSRYPCGQRENTSRHSPALPTPLCRNTAAVPLPRSMILTVPPDGVRSMAIGKCYSREHRLHCEHVLVGQVRE
jgi:hypothetical protein